jgi:tRNA/rRNA methyltransferase
MVGLFWFLNLIFMEVNKVSGIDFTFILVEPAVPENIGASARAIKTMGFNSLVLINPCDHLSAPARWLAHGSHDILENAVTFSTLTEVVPRYDFVIGTSAKRRSVKFDYFPLTGLSGFLQSKGRTIKHVAIVFGREESGLRNDELRCCDIVTTIPMHCTFPSLNLSQAVMLYAWELSKMDQHIDDKLDFSHNQSLRSLFEKVSTVLKKSGFKEDTAIYNRFIERIGFLEEGDIHLLHSFCARLLDS